MITNTTVHLESWNTKKALPACGADSYDHTQSASSVTCSACRRWLVKQWCHWAHTGWIERKKAEAGAEAGAGAVTHYISWKVDSKHSRGVCLQEIGEPINATGTAEFVSCAACQHALMAGWINEKAPEFRCVYCAGITLSWMGTPTECGHCKRTFLDVRDDPEFVASVHNVMNTIRDHVRKYPDRYIPGSSLTRDMDHVCSYLALTISEEWQDEDRVYTPAEQQLDCRIDGCTGRHKAAPHSLLQIQGTN